MLAAALRNEDYLKSDYCYEKGCTYVDMYMLRTHINNERNPLDDSIILIHFK